MVLGNEGNDIFTHSGNYTVVIDGGKGNDQLSGGSGDDILNGGEGDDLLFWGLGQDVLTGGNGKDLFILNKSNTTSYAVIKDFEVNIDQLKLKGKATDYVLGSTQQGLGIYVKTSGQNELISILEGINSNNFDLNTNAIYLGQ